MHCIPSMVIKIECKTELHKNEMVKMINKQNIIPLIIDNIKEISIEG
jgi:hypothetical protein